MEVTQIPSHTIRTPDWIISLLDGKLQIVGSSPATLSVEKEDSIAE
jgi:hypothetical protein